MSFVSKASKLIFDTEYIPPNETWAEKTGIYSLTFTSIKFLENQVLWLQPLQQRLEFERRRACLKPIIYSLCWKVVMTWSIFLAGIEKVSLSLAVSSGWAWGGSTLSMVSIKSLW